MAKVNRLALVRLALQVTMQELSREEKLRVLADIYSPACSDIVCWNGGPAAEGALALDQGIYFSVTKLRIVADLWRKLKLLGAQPHEEIRIIRNTLMNSLADADRDVIMARPSLQADIDDDLPENGKAPQSERGAEQMKLAVGSDNPSKFAPGDNDKRSFSV